MFPATNLGDFQAMFDYQRVINKNSNTMNYPKP